MTHSFRLLARSLRRSICPLRGVGELISCSHQLRWGKPVRRREFIAILGALAASPLVARAQQGGRPPVVGLVFAVTPVSGMAGPDPTEPPARAFIHALRDLGWVDGQTVVVERRSAEGEPANAPAILGELVVRRADVIVLSGAPWLLQAAQRATRDVPIVAMFQDDPAAAGHIASFGSPGGNLTGLTLTTGTELIGKRLQLLKELAPGISRGLSWDATVVGGVPRRGRCSCRRPQSRPPQLTFIVWPTARL